MKTKIAAVLLAAVTCLSLCACGKTEAAQAADDLIAAIGEVTLSSEGAISAAESAVAALTDEDLKGLEGAGTLEQARSALEELKKAKLISDVEDAIAAIGEVNLDSGDAISAARKAYDSLDSALRNSVSSYSVLTEAEDAFFAAQVRDVEDVIDAIGTVTLDSASTIDAALAVCDRYDGTVLEAVSNYDRLVAAEERLSQLRIESVQELIGAIGEQVTPDSAAAVEAAQSAFDALSAEEQGRVANAQALSAASAQYNELKAAAELQAEIDEARGIIRVTNVAFSSPDSAGGVELYFNFVNNSEKTIKYINFGVTFYNAVGDVAVCQYKKDIINYCTETGPYEKGEGLSGNYWYWGDYYNWEIASCELVYLNIEYMDGTEVTLTQDQIDYVQY